MGLRITQFCQTSTNAVKNLCGTETYTSEKFCSGTTVYEKCNGDDYNPSTQRCANSIVETKCGNSWYNASNSDFRCKNDVVETTCAGEWYGLSALKFCFEGKFYDKCGGESYNPLRQFCQAGTNTVKDFCGGTVKYPEDKFCDFRDNKLYKQVPIGTQIWMAENLNYNAIDGNSRCYGENDRVYDRENNKYVTMSSSEIQDNCNKYGRLYSWATVMNFPIKCNYTYYPSDADCAKSTNHQDICPDGWHIPSDDDWNVLMEFVSPGCSYNDCADAGTKLKTATSDWAAFNEIPTGTDDRKFAALLGGFYDPIINVHFSGIREIGIWLSSSEYGTDVYRRLIYNSNKNTIRNYGYKSFLVSVRCVKDN
jgi:uncharacterized protein (TIGR02145 family)